jgi:hypothetical protein
MTLRSKGKGTKQACVYVPEEIVRGSSVQCLASGIVEAMEYEGCLVLFRCQMYYRVQCTQRRILLSINP